MIRGGYLDGPWGQVHYNTVGDGSGPVVVLCHESPLSARVFRPALARAPGWLTVLALDTPGYGSSDPAPGPETELPEYAAALLAALDGHGTGRFVAGGVHTGAGLAIELARQAGSGRVPGTVLSGVPMWTDADRQWHLEQWAPPVARAPDGAQFRWAIDRYQHIWGPDVPAGLLHRAVTEVMRCLDTYNWAYNACFRWQATAPLREIAGTPMLLITAEHDSLASADPWVRELVPGARAEVFPGLPGQPHQREPARYMNLVAAFARQAWDGQAAALARQPAMISSTVFTQPNR